MALVASSVAVFPLNGPSSPQMSPNSPNPEEIQLISFADPDFPEKEVDLTDSDPQTYQMWKEDPEYRYYFKNQDHIDLWVAKADECWRSNYRPSCALPEELFLKRCGKWIRGYAEECRTQFDRMCLNKDCDYCNQMELFLEELKNESEFENYYLDSFPAGCVLPPICGDGNCPYALAEECEMNAFHMCTADKKCQYCDEMFEWLYRNAGIHSRKRVECPGEMERSKAKRTRGRRNELALLLE